ncbi:unnamed protein product [Symbiodinium pilosum]|uniref:Ubiquitin-like domain-containing protein n=1 Tax=Symbiodinium pilosum TaxID=2952 RepID=A0A812P6F1_SYMPI|nr:unnamed protein product [Symbiodinium pilosum]
MAEPAEPDDTMELRLLQPSGDCTPLVVQRKHTVSQVINSVKQAIPAAEGQIVELLYNTTRLQHADTLSQSGLNEGDAITVLLRKPEILISPINGVMPK